MYCSKPDYKSCSDILLTLGLAGVVFATINPLFSCAFGTLRVFLIPPVPSLPRSLRLPIEGFAFAFLHEGVSPFFDEVSERLLRSLSRYGYGPASLFLAANQGTQIR